MTTPELTASPDALAALARLLAERNRQLERALETRIVIEQAKGVLAERLGIAPKQAFEVLRRAARNERRRIHDIAGEVVASRETTPAITQAVDQLARAQ